MIYIKRFVYLIIVVLLFLLATILGLVFVVLSPILAAAEFIIKGELKYCVDFLFEYLPDCINWTLEWFEKKLFTEKKPTKNIKQ